MTQGIVHGSRQASHSTLIYTLELILCSTICMEIYLVSISGVLTLLFRDVRKLSTPLARSLLSGRFIIYFTNAYWIGKSLQVCKCNRFP